MCHAPAEVPAKSGPSQPPRSPSCCPTTLLFSLTARRNLVPEAVPVGTAQPGWVEVQVKAVGINFR